jgi:hypothetical protein
MKSTIDPIGRQYGQRVSTIANSSSGTVRRAVEQFGER